MKFDDIMNRLPRNPLKKIIIFYHNRLYDSLGGAKRNNFSGLQKLFHFATGLKKNMLNVLEMTEVHNKLLRLINIDQNLKC